MQRAGFEQLVRETAYRPADRDALLADLQGQLDYLAEPRADGLGALADALAIAFSAGAESALPDLVRLAAANPKQPLCQFYLAAARREVGDAPGEREAVAALARADPTDPMAELLRLKLDGQPVPTVTEEVRLANIAKMAASPLLRNPYRLAVGAIFEAIRDRDQACVLDVGVSGFAPSDKRYARTPAVAGVRGVELSGLLSNPQFSSLLQRIEARLGDEPVEPNDELELQGLLPLPRGFVLKTIRDVLREHPEGLRTVEVRGLVEKRIGRAVSPSTVKGALAEHSGPHGLFIRRTRGVYHLRHAS